VGDALEDWQEGRVVTEPLRIRAGALFAQDIESHLPYREVIAKERFSRTNVMMDENQIVFLKVRLYFISNYMH
jgi:hypothetical protein